jgi:hypothetical protein
MTGNSEKLSAGPEQFLARELSETKELIRTLIIIQLELAGVPQRQIRTIAECDINRVSKVLKNVKPKIEKRKSQD